MTRLSTFGSGLIPAQPDKTSKKETQSEIFIFSSFLAAYQIYHFSFHFPLLFSERTTRSRKTTQKEITKSKKVPESPKMPLKVPHRVMSLDLMKETIVFATDGECDHQMVTAILTDCVIQGKVHWQDIGGLRQVKQQLKVVNGSTFMK